MRDLVESLLTYIDLFLEGSYEDMVNKRMFSTQAMKQLKDPDKTRIIAGEGASNPYGDANRIANMYGGKPEHWEKISSRRYRGRDGADFEIHAARNIHTKEVVEPKTNIYGKNVPKNNGIPTSTKKDYGIKVPQRRIIKMGRR